MNLRLAFAKLYWMHVYHKLLVKSWNCKVIVAFIRFHLFGGRTFVVTLNELARLNSVYKKITLYNSSARNYNFIFEYIRTLQLNELDFIKDSIFIPYNDKRHRWQYFLNHIFCCLDFFIFWFEMLWDHICVYSDPMRKYLFIFFGVCC